MPSYFPFLSQDWPTRWSEAEAGQQGAPAVKSKGRQCQEPDPRILLHIHPSLALGLLMPLQNLHLPLCLQPYRSHLFTTTATVFLIIHSPFFCQINVPKMYFRMSTFIYRGSLKLLDLMCQTVCLFLMPHLGYLAVSLPLLPSLHHLVNKITHSLTQPLIQVFQASHSVPAILGQLHRPAILTPHSLYCDFFNPHLLTSFIRPYPYSPVPPNCKPFNGRGCVLPIS